MRSRSLRILLILTIALGVLACDLSTLGLAPAAKPKVIIQSHVSGAQFLEGEEIAVQSTSSDPTGVVRVELAVDGATVRADAPPIPQGQTSFTLIQKWQATGGTHTLSVRAFNVSNAASDPALVSVTVAAVVVASPVPPPVAPSPQVILPPIGTTPTLPPVVPTPITPVAPIAPTPTRSPTRVPPSPTLSAPPGVYALAIAVNSAAPKRNQGVGFTVTFLNTTGKPQSYRWRIRIFEPDKRNSFGDTSPLTNDIPAGTSNLPSTDNWKVGGPGDCMTFFARAFWIDPESKQETEFLKPDGSGGPATQFQVCP